MVRYIYPHFGCPTNIWLGFKLCQDTRLFCWLDKLPTTSRIKKLTLWCQVIGIGKGGTVSSHLPYTRFIPILLLVAVILLLVVSNKNFFVFFPYFSQCVADGAVHRQQHQPAPPPPPQWANNGWPPPREDKQSTLSRWVSPHFWTFSKNWRVRERRRFVNRVTFSDDPTDNNPTICSIIGKNKFFFFFNVLIIPSFLFDSSHSPVFRREC